MTKHEPSEDRIHQCEVCHKNFKGLSTLIQHQKLIHSENGIKPKDKKFKCRICDRKYYYERHLNFHVRKHREDKRYECPRANCFENFFYSDAVKWHLVRVHFEKAPYNCKVCKKKFIHEKPMQNHVRTHKTGENSFICTICGKILSEGKNYMRHMRTHEEKSFKVHFLC